MRTTWAQLHSFSEELANEKRKVMLIVPAAGNFFREWQGCYLCVKQLFQSAYIPRHYVHS